MLYIKEIKYKVKELKIQNTKIQNNNKKRFNIYNRQFFIIK